MLKKITMAIVILLLAVSSNLLIGETEKTSKKSIDKGTKRKDKVLKYEITVTATGRKADKFSIPKAVSIINQEDLKQKSPENISEILTALPGTDINGTGANQGRPVIRGMRGQRVLLMADGLRLNNSRRQQDFGEIPVLINQENIEQVEIVRGPSSVLYGSDAIGGVMNIVSKSAPVRLEGSSLRGALNYRYGSESSQNSGTVSLKGHLNQFSFTFRGNLRKAESYSAPSGKFGNIRLNEKTKVYNTGVKDRGFNLSLNWNFTTSSYISFKTDIYRAEDAGFGYISPEEYNPGSSTVELLYPYQKMNRYTLKYENSNLNSFFADRISISTYYLSNIRDLDMNISIPMNIPGNPAAGIHIKSKNHTDVKTTGLRLELNRAISSHTLTYGMDYYRDKSRNRDYSSTEVITFGPPKKSESNMPQVPNAKYSSLGFFIQDEFNIIAPLKTILGVRYQSVKAETEKTEGLDEPVLSSTDETVVATANFIYSLTDNIKLVGSAGRGFRSPNLIERFFQGNTPDGSGYQIRNTDLKAETSLNFDLGFRYRTGTFYVEFTWFNNTIRNGIRVVKTGRMIGRRPEYQNVNVDKLRMRGYEAAARVLIIDGLELSGNYTRIFSKDLGNPDTPYVDTYSSKLVFDLNYKRGIFNAGYTVRINGEQKDAQLVNNPIGEVIPGFTVHSARCGITLFKGSGYAQELSLILNNLTNKLYSEFSNTSFFRPSKGREIILSWRMSF